MDETIAESPFGNTYGGLDMILRNDGKLYLKMGDCLGDKYYGPLNDEQVKAFMVICQVTFVY